MDDEYSKAELEMIRQAHSEAEMEKLEKRLNDLIKAAILEHPQPDEEISEALKELFLNHKKED